METNELSRDDTKKKMKTLSNVERVHERKISIMISQINLRKLTATAQQSASVEEK